MGDETKISWADKTFNPWVGCTKVSPACDHCYAEAWATRFGGMEWGRERRRTSAANWRKPRQWDKKAARAGVRYRVFCASLADVFDNQIDEQWRIDLWKEIAATPNLDWLLLTKRPQNIVKMLPDNFGLRSWGQGWPNVWMGTTTEDQQSLSINAWALSLVPARVKFLSYEPALGPLNLTCVTNRWGTSWNALTGRITHAMSGPPNVGKIDWVICGGESGTHARPMHPDWARSVRDQCAEAGVAFHFKQWGNYAPTCWAAHSKGRYVNPMGHAAKMPDDMRIFALEKAGFHAMEDIGIEKAGRLLDGIEHLEFPRSA